MSFPIYLFSAYLSVYLYLKHIFCRQHVVESCSFIQSGNLCLLIGVFSPVQKRVNIVGLSLDLALGRPGCKFGLWLASGNLALGVFPVNS